MTKEQQEEFTSLKYARAEQRGFFTPEQKERWNVLHALHGARLKKQLQDLDKRMDEVRLSKLN
jgi:hypothetical protein